MSIQLRSLCGLALSRGKQKRRYRRGGTVLRAVDALEQRIVLNSVLPFEYFNNIDWTSAGVSGISRYSEESPVADLPISRGSGEIQIDGISGNVAEAWLVWHGIDQTNWGGDGVYDNATIQFNGQSITGFSRGTSDTAGWGPGGSQTFLANVSQYVTGNGTYQLDDLSAKPGHSANGASLIVIFDDGDADNNRDLHLYFGNQSRVLTLQAENMYYNGGDLNAQLIVADGQSHVDASLLFSAINSSAPPVVFDDHPEFLDGTTVPSEQSSRASNGNLWDMHDFNITGAVDGIVANDERFGINMTLGSGSNDSLKWIGLLIDQPTDGSITGNARPVAEDVYLETDEMQDISGQMVGTDADGDPLTYRVISMPQNGFMQYSSVGGRFFYNPNDFYTGLDTFTYVVNDGQADSAPATVYITVRDVNSPPMVSAQTFRGTEDYGITSRIQASDFENDPLTFSEGTTTSHGSLTLHPGGTFEYQPDANFFGIDQFTVRVSDGTSTTEQQISFDIASVNDVPVAETAVFELNEDSMFNGRVQATDADVADSLTYELVNDVLFGTLTFRSDGTFTYRPDANYNGADFFSFRASDGTASSESTMIGLDVLPVNDRPSAQFNSFTTPEDRHIFGQVIGTDIDGDVLTFANTTEPSHGTLVFENDGTFTYTPDANFYGTDEFRYSVYDGQLYSYSQGTARISVTPVDDAPIAIVDSYDVPEDGSISFIVPQTDFGFVSESGEYVGAGQTLDYSPENAHFSVYRSSTNSFIGFSIRSYTNTSDYWSVDFAAPAGETLSPGTYTGATRYPFQDAEDPGLSISGQHRGYNTSVGEFTITQLVTADDGSIENFAATFWQASYEGAPRMTGAINYNYVDGSDVGSVLFNDFDLDGDQITATLVDGPEHGTLTFRADGSFDYTPDPDFTGTDGFTYRATDGTLESGLGFVTLNVTPTNDTPVAVGGTIITNEDQSASGQLTANDIDGDELLFSLVQEPNHGTLILDADGSYEYIPHANYHGTDSFTFRVNDGTEDSNLAAVDIDVQSVNDTPIAYEGVALLGEDGVVTGQLTGFDADGDTLSFELISGPAHGTLQLAPDGAYTYTPDANYHGDDHFTFVSNDGTATSSVVEYLIRIRSINDAPIAFDSQNDVSEDGNVTGSVQGQDVDGDAITFSLVQQPAHGTLQFTASGNYSYTPNANYFGSDSFTFLASDGTESSTPATVALNVTPVNDAPSLEPATFSLAENSNVGTAVGAVTGNDIDSSDLTYAITSGNEAGAFAINAVTGEITVVDSAPLDFETTPTFNLVVSVTDGSLTASAAVTVNLLDEAEVLSAEIDFSPKDSDNQLRLRKTRTVKVALLSTSEFNLSDVDVSSLELRIDGQLMQLKTKGRWQTPKISYSDVDRDGRDDLVVEFEFDRSGLNPGTVPVELSGTLNDGRELRGESFANLR
ncbi:tandem-95 repeat protein [Rubinisphaera margarita]|uniref:tandem-95 repeat protein n=1 Tax=Rubinisphaera margarita TaxID=2909586 RepID=UPI001EE7B84A|nr:Ig-like domain-containing protein [Rubinisphaera margarita]MCG6156582.1 Ig-like domain-containing protein [Rubinisphaera margarita]